MQLDVEKLSKKNYKLPDGKITFDRLSSLHFSSVNHTENQPIHLKLKDEKYHIK